MKVLQIINSLSIGGAEKLILDIVPLFQEKGIEVDVLCLNGSDSSFMDELNAKTNGEIFVSSSLSVYNPLHIFKIMPYFKKYDVINIHLFPSLYWVVLAKLISFSKVKLVYTEHSTSNRRRNNFLFKILDKFIYKRVDKIITIADEVDYNIKNHLNLPHNKFKLINNGVDVHLYTSAAAYDKNIFFDRNDTIIIQVSSFRKPKDQVTLIKSLSQLPDDVKLLLVGDGHLRANCEELVADKDLQDRVKFLGNRRDIPRLLKTADIVILSSEHEGMSLSNIEGMSVNKPFIGSNVQGIREVVNGYGLLFEQGDEKELAEYIMDLLNDKEYYKEISYKCLKRAQEFDINRMVDSYIELYKELL